MMGYGRNRGKTWPRSRIRTTRTRTWAVLRNARGKIERLPLRKRYIRADGSLLHAGLEVRHVRLRTGYSYTRNDQRSPSAPRRAAPHARDLNAMLSRINAMAHAGERACLRMPVHRGRNGYFGYARPSAPRAPTLRRWWTALRRRMDQSVRPRRWTILCHRNVERQRRGWRDLTDVARRTLRAADP
jgi:hypothetical protein